MIADRNGRLEERFCCCQFIAEHPDVFAHRHVSGFGKGAGGIAIEVRHRFGPKMPPPLGSITAKRRHKFPLRRGARKTQEGGRPLSSFFVSLQRLYWVCRGNPATAINGRRNKPFGPGGSTRRLHPSPPPNLPRLREGLGREISAGPN